jgi:hypothetical protein
MIFLFLFEHAVKYYWLTDGVPKGAKQAWAQVVCSQCYNAIVHMHAQYS